MQSAARSYFQTQVTTTTQGDLLIMLFDGALKFLSQAREKLLEKNYAQKGILISKALDILTELQATLNPEKGGKLAERLRMLYLYCSTRLLRANMSLDVDALDETVRILTGLREAFAEANSRVTTRAVEATSAQDMAPRIVPTSPAMGHGAALGNLGVAAYAKAGVASETPQSAVPAASPAQAAGPSSRQPASDGPSLEDIQEAIRNVPPAPPVVTVQETDPAPVAVQPRPITPVRRAMAAYSSGTTR
jgi:flagellar protein FliS